MVLQKLILDKLIEYQSDPTQLDPSLNSDLHAHIVKSIASNQLDIRTSFHEIATDKDLTIETDILKSVRDVSMIKVDYMDSYDAFNAKTYKVKPKLIDFLGRYLIKRRATYLFIYMLLQQKHTELLKIFKMLGDKFNDVQNMIIPEEGISPMSDIKEILINLNEELQKKIKPVNPKLAEDINMIFTKILSETSSQHQVDYIYAFASLGELIALLNGKTEGYKALVTDIIPLMAEWNDTNIHSV